MKRKRQRWSQNAIFLQRLNAFIDDSIADAVADLGKPGEIGQVFFGFQKYLYQPRATAS